MVREIGRSTGNRNSVADTDMMKRAKGVIEWAKFFKRESNGMVVYKITPHKNVTNNTNRKVWKSLHKMYEIYDRMPSRRERSGLRFTLREKDTIWFDIVFQVVDGEKRVEFYTATTEIWARKYKQVLENRMKVTVEEVDISVLQIPDDATVYDLRYLRHDVFSMQTDAREQVTPISSIMSAIEDVEDEGDYARYSVCAETMNRSAWSKLASYAHEKFSKGEVPQRSRISREQVVRGMQTAVAKVANEAHSLIVDTVNAIGKVFMKDGATLEKKPVIEKVAYHDIEKMSAQSREKQFAPVWKVRTRVVTCGDKLRRELRANTIIGSFAEIGDDNELHGMRVNVRGRRKQVIEEMNTLQLSPRTKMDGDVNVMSCDELAKIALQMPTAEVQKRYEDALTVNRKIETEIPSIFQDDSGILIGYSEVKGELIPIYLPVKYANQFFKGYVFQGGMGAGKDTALQNFVVEGAMKHNISFVIIDQVNKEGREGMANGIRDSLPPDKIVDLDMSDNDYSIPLDITEVMRKLGRRGADRFADELVDFFGDVESMSRTRKYLRWAAKASGGSLQVTKQILEEQEYRMQKADEMEQQGNHRVANELRSWGEQNKIDSKIAPVMDRLDTFFGNDLLYNTFTQPPMPEMDFEKWMREGKIIIIRVPDRKLGTSSVKTLVHWIALKTLMTRLLMDNEGQENGAFIVFNEPQTYMTDGLRKLMARVAVQGRKERLGSLFAFHHIGQIPDALADDLRAGGVHWFLFANDHKKVFETMKEELAPTFTVDDALRIPQHHAINILNFGESRQDAFLVHMLPPCYERYEAHDNSFLTQRHCRMYGRKVEEVERMLIQQEVQHG